MKKTELYAKLSSKEFDKLTREEIDYLKTKISNDKLGLKLDFTEMDKEDLENYFILREEESLGVNVKKNQPNNLLIEGDNYHALKALKTAGVRVDIIYIDPPYNTGKEFVYKDDFGTPKVVGSDDPHKHSKWLSFMKKRLELAKELLTDEGIIFVSIDDNEQAYLKVLMDDIFGEGNFISSLPRIETNQGKNDVKTIANRHDYVLAYSSIQNLNGMFNNNDVYKFDDNDGRGPYHLKNHIIATKSQGYIKSLDFPVTFNGDIFEPIDKNGRNRWRWNKERIDAAIKLNILVAKNGFLYQKNYRDLTFETGSNLLLQKNKFDRAFSSVELIDNSFSNKEGTKDLFERIGLDFSNPKPVTLIKKLISLYPNQNSIVLDFFAGSGTTGQAVMELNVEDEGRRRFIMVTNNEMTGIDTNREPEKGIARAITRERIFRVINEHGSKNEQIKWSMSGALKDNSMAYLVVDPVHKVNGEYESIDSEEVLYKREFNKEISIEDFE